MFTLGGYVTAGPQQVSPCPERRVESHPRPDRRGPKVSNEESEDALDANASSPAF